MKRAWFASLLSLALAAPVLAAPLAPASQRFADAGTQEVPDFQRHVLPLMGRVGCNGRACHGSFQGRGGFRLSLFGYDFAADLEAIAKGDKPRVNLDNPLESLILQKPTLTIDHEGGDVIAKDSWQHHVLLKWIEAGAQGVDKDAPALAGLSVEPAEFVFDEPGQTFQMRAIAHWADGTSEDVTPLCRDMTNDDAIASVSEDGLVTCLEKGDTHIVAYYDNGVGPVPVLLPVSDQIGPKYPQIPTPTKVDELIVSKLKKLGIVPSELAGDAEFLRRVSLDMTGTLPTPQEVETFMADKSQDKRAKKIDELLERPGYAAWWTTKLCDYTRVNPQNAAERDMAVPQARQWYDWIYRRVEQNAPYDELVAGLVLAVSRESEDQSFEDYCRQMAKYYAEGSEADFAARETMPHYWTRRMNNNPPDMARYFAYSFLGVRLECAECHKHPFDQWTKQDFEQFTAFFQPLSYGTRNEDRQTFREMQESLGLRGKRGNELRKAIAKLAEEGKVIPMQELYVARQGEAPARRRRNAAPAGRVITPKLLGDGEVLLTDYRDPREALMEWMRQKDNPYFARAFVNRVWANYFGVGIVDPPDEQSLGNPPSNKPLLDYLEQGFVASGYDMKWLHREITLSDAYQRSWKPNATNELDSRNFSHAHPRRLPAEIVHDALAQSTASSEELVKLVTDTSDRAIGPHGVGAGNGRAQRMDYTLSVFGKPEREDNCDCQRNGDPSLLQTLFLRNDGDMLRLIDRRDGWLAEIQRGSSSPAAQADDSKAAQIASQMERLRERLARLKEKGDRAQIARLRQNIERLETQLAANEPAEKGAAKLDKTAAADLVHEAYLRTVSRPPTSEEQQRAVAYLNESESPTTGLRDLVWALLNTKEFVLNH